MNRHILVGLVYIGVIFLGVISTIAVALLWSTVQDWMVSV